ncbi:hypothetical protein HOY80DRAFT_298089 [Tuber brumale]|nr:hypothetical protein HOY80DRAFT_298089 [Tuber brumale]
MINEKLDRQWQNTGTIPILRSIDWLELLHGAHRVRSHSIHLSIVSTLPSPFPTVSLGGLSFFFLFPLFPSQLAKMGNISLTADGPWLTYRVLGEGKGKARESGACFSLCDNQLCHRYMIKGPVLVLLRARYHTILVARYRSTRVHKKDIFEPGQAI